MGFAYAFQKIYYTMGVFFCILNTNEEKPLKILISISIFHNIKILNQNFTHFPSSDHLKIYMGLLIMMNISYFNNKKWRYIDIAM